MFDFQMSRCLIKGLILFRYLQVNRRTLDYPRQLFVYAQNIVDGMEYLTQNKIIHRFLSCYNTESSMLFV